MDTNSDKIMWIPTTKDEYPHVVEGGQENTTEQKGNSLYVGRGKIDEGVFPGKVYDGASGPGIYFACSGREHFLKNYDILVTMSSLDWISDSKGDHPPNSVNGGKDGKGNTLFVARAKAEDGTKCPGYLCPADGRCFYTFKGKQCDSEVYDVLVEK